MRLRIFLVAVLFAVLLPVPALAVKFKPIRLAVIDTGISETTISKTNISAGTNPNDTITREQISSHTKTLSPQGSSTGICTNNFSAKYNDIFILSEDLVGYI